MQLDKERVLKIIHSAIKEDMPLGDITTDNVVSSDKNSKAIIIANEEFVLCGINIAEWILNEINNEIAFKPMFKDGQTVFAGQEIAFIQGNARGILKAERSMLNFISILSSISTKTRKYVYKVKSYQTKILDTRKTIPLLRYLQKYAVFIGGGTNHRMSLSDMVMIKDNHIAIEKKQLNIENIRARVQTNIKIEVEVDSLEQFRDIITQKPDIILLDNMNVDTVCKAVDMRNDFFNNTDWHVLLEASGGMDIDNIENYAKSGVDMISVGALTDEIKGVDVSLNFIV
jgi:nicotinate-nucleotide pyrophosphorylase (carboxylating)